MSGDLISREDVMLRVREFIGNKSYDELMLVNDLNALPSVEPERKWIPVTEALPRNDTNVLVTVRDDSGNTPWEYTSVGWRIPDGQYWVVDNEMCYGVVAWMPLPEPWRGG